MLIGEYSHETEEYVKASKAPVCVDYKVATDAAMKNCVDSGTAYTSSDIDYTIKVEAKNLKAYTQYCEPWCPKRLCHSNSTQTTNSVYATPIT